MKNAKSAAADTLRISPSLRKETWQFLEVKQMGDILARHREKARLALREYRQLVNAQKAETDAIEKLYLGYEGTFMRDHLRDTLRLYMTVQHDYHRAYDTYMNEIKAPAMTTMPIPSELLTATSSKRSRKAA